MKRLPRLAFLVTLVLAPMTVIAGQPAAVGGQWKVNANIGGTATELTCNFTQKEAELTGTCAGPQGELPITGKVDAKAVSWQINTSWEGQALTVIYSGTVDADKIAGGVDVQPLNVSGDFTATKVTK